jgi:hypothetical protein
VDDQNCRGGSPRRRWGAGGRVARAVTTGALGVLALAVASFAGAGLHAHAAEIIPDDVWVDNVGGHAGPFHDDDRQLACAPITVTGARFEHGGGSYAILLIRPTGRGQQVLKHDWTYDRAARGIQLLDTISGADLVASAKALGISPHGSTGYHFTFRFLEQPHQHKPFWVSADCPAKKAAALPPAPAAAAPAPAVPAPVPPASGTRAAAVTAPKTGADLPWEGALELVLAGIGCLGVARRLRSRRAISRG